MNNTRYFGIILILISNDRYLRINPGKDKGKRHGKTNLTITNNYLVNYYCETILFEKSLSVCVRYRCMIST